MFTFFRASQNTLRRYLLGGVLLIVAASMLTYLTQTGLTTTTDGDPILAEVGGQKITVVEAQTLINRLIQNQRLPQESAEVYLGQYVDELVQQRAAVDEFLRMGMRVTDEEVLRGAMLVFPQFFENGKLTNRPAMEQALSAQGMGLREFADSMRENLLLHKIQSVAAANIIVSPDEVDQALTQKHQKAKVEYVAFPAAKFRDQVKLAPETLRAIFESSKAAYSIPEHRSFQVLVVDQAKVEQTITVPEAQVRAAYSGSMDNYRVPERVKARHILLMTQGKPDAEKKTKLTKAQDLLKQLRGGADFAELAKKNSEDPGSAQNGGDLGYLVKGQTVPEFEKTAFSAKPKDISDVVTTEYGYHIIQVTEKEAARIRPFDEVKENIATELKKQTVAEKTQAIADQAHAALEKAPGTIADIAKQFNIELITVTKASANEAIPTLGVSPEIDGAVSGLQPKGISPTLALPANRIAMVVLTERIASRPAEFAEVEAQVRDRQVTNQSQQLASKAAQDAIAKVNAGESLEKVGKAMGGDVAKPAEFTRNDSVEGLGPAAYVDDAFNKPVGTTVGPVNAQGREIVYRIVDRQPVDLKSFAAERDATIADLKQRKLRTRMDLLLDSIVTKARADKKVKIHTDTLKRLQAQYRQGR